MEIIAYTWQNLNWSDINHNLTGTLLIKDRSFLSSDDFFVAVISVEAAA